MSKAILQTLVALGTVLAIFAVRGDEIKKRPSKPVVPAIKPAAPVPPLPPAQPKAPAAVENAKAPTLPVIDIGKIELVTERYPDGKVKIEREVGQDAKGNYINQGVYKLYAQNGDVIKSGEFLHGKQSGRWTQKLVKDEGHLFSSSQDTQWTGPFTSEANFENGKLHGYWTIKDGKGKNIIQWSFDNGMRSGPWVWWYPNGQKQLEATYVNGVLTGEVVEHDREGKAVNETTYVDGKYMVKALGWYTLGKKRYEGAYLRTPNMAEATYDWWDSKIANLGNIPSSPNQQHGVWTEWYPNGNKKIEGKYDRGVVVGKFTWWYENGQVQAEGDYDAGQKTGTWVTWHPSGLKESIADYKDGKRISKFSRWSEDGKLIETREDAPPTVIRGSQRSSTAR